MALTEHEKALACLREGRLPEAERLYRDILKAAPGDPLGLYFLGVVRMQQGRFEEARSHIAASLALRQDARAFASHGYALRMLGRLDEALASYDRAAALSPALADAHHSRGVILADLGRFEEALAAYNQALALDADDPDIWINRSVALLDLRRGEEALQSARKARDLNPASPEACNNLGIALHAMGEHAQALESYGQALALRPDFAGVYICRGLVLKDQRKFSEALKDFEKAVALNPGDTGAWTHLAVTQQQLDRGDQALTSFNRALAQNIGDLQALLKKAELLHKLRRLDQALAEYDRLLAKNPGHAQAWSGRGWVLYDLQRAANAIASYDKALACDPDCLDALRGRGNLLWSEKRELASAIRDLERAARLKPDYGYILGDLLHLKMQGADWRDFEAEVAAIDAKALAGERVIQPLHHLAISDDPAALKASAVTYTDHLYPAQPVREHAKTRPHDKIRLGYVCGEFREHPIGFLTAGLMEMHDRSAFDIIAFDNGFDDGSPTRKRFEGAFEKLIDISAWSDEAVVEKVMAEEIDILVDVNGHTRNNRLAVFAQRPAPVQVAYLAFPGTMGAPYLDYVIADPMLIEPGEEAFYSEKVVRLPDCYQANDSRRPAAAETKTRAAHGLPADAFVLCNFNHIWKIAPAIFAVWMRVMRQVPGSVLWLLASNPLCTRNLRAQAEAAGVKADRILFAPMTSQAQHIARLSHADLCVDTLPYNAHTTGSDALWAGVPLVTCRGNAFAGRVASSLVTAIGMPELSAENLQAYESLILALATDAQRLAALRARLAEQRQTAPLFNTDRYRRHLEAAYRMMWEKKRHGEAPHGFNVPTLSPP